MKAIRPCLGFAVLAAACAGPTVPAPPPAPEKVVTAPATAPVPKAAPEPKATLPQPAPSREPSKPAPAKPAPAPAPAKPTAPVPAPVKEAAPAPAPAPAKATAPPLDLRTLEERLKGTSAIGVLTKLSLKNQVDDLIAKFKTYHAGARPPTLTELNPSFDLLLMKELSLDAALARDINASRDAIWGVLTDKQKLAEFS